MLMVLSESVREVRAEGLIVESPWRSVLKGLTWRLVATATTVAIALLVTGEVGAALAIGGVALGFFRPKTRLPHGCHVLLSTWASLFHMTTALGDSFYEVMLVPIAAFLFLAVWVPCSTSDIIFPLLFQKMGATDDTR